MGIVEGSKPVGREARLPDRDGAGDGAGAGAGAGVGAAAAAPVGAT